MGLCLSTIKIRTGLNMSRKPEALSAPNSLYLALSAAAQCIQTIAGTWDTCSPSQKAEMLELTEQVTASVTALLVANLAQSKLISDETKLDNGELPSAICCKHTSPYLGDGSYGICKKCE